MNKKFVVLPAPISLGDSSASDDISDEEVPPPVPQRKFVILGKRNPNQKKTIKHPVKKQEKPKIQEEDSDMLFPEDSSSLSKSNLSSHSQLMSQNFSTFEPSKYHLIGESTQSALKFDAYRNLVIEADGKNKLLRNTKYEKEQRLRQERERNRKRIMDMRNKTEKNIELNEKSKIIRKNEIRKVKAEINKAMEDRNIDQRYITMNEKTQSIEDLISSFDECKEIIDTLNKIIVYEPLSESDFDVILATRQMNSPLGLSLNNLINAARETLVEKHNQDI